MDPATALQTATAAITIIELTARIVKRFEEYRQAHGNVPESLQSLADQLPYLRRLFEAQDDPNGNGSFLATRRRSRPSYPIVPEAFGSWKKPWIH